MLIVLVGDGGSGKSTLAQYLRRKYGFTVADSLPDKPVPTTRKVVVDPKYPRPTLSTLFTDGRRLAGHVETLNGFVVEITRTELSGIRVVLPNGAFPEDEGRMLRTADRLLSSMGVRPKPGVYRVRDGMEV